MKKFILILLTALLPVLVLGGLPHLSMPALGNPDNVLVSLDAPAQVAPGSDFTVTVNITQVTNFDATNYDITFNPAVLRLDGITSGLIGTATIPVDAYSDAQLRATGTCSVIQNVPGLPGVAGSGKLAVLHFRVVGAAGTSSSIGLANGALSSITAESIPATWSGSAVTVVSPGAASIPIISNLSPSPGTSTAEARPVISASYTDTVAGINVATVRMVVDDSDVTDEAAINASSVNYTPPSLSAGTHSVKVSVSNSAGRESSQSWSFQVIAAGTLPGLPAGTTDVSSIIQSSGVFTQSATARSTDSRCAITVGKDTKGLTGSGVALNQISVAVSGTPPSPPQNSSIIGQVYELGPDGATFDRPVVVTFTYTDAMVPAGVAEDKLVVAFWDKNASKWVNLASTVDTRTNIITASANHFTPFTILGGTSPAAFTVSKLSITPAEVVVGGSVTISVLVTNSGDVSGSYNVSLKINDAVVETKGVTLSSKGSQTVTFTTSRSAAGTYKVSLDGLAGSFVVKATTSPTSTPTATPTSQPTPTLTQTPTPTPKPTTAPASVPSKTPAGAVNWTVLWMVIGGVVAVVFLIFLLARRRRLY